MKTVRDIMTTDVIRVGPMNKIKTAIILMKGHNIGGLPVMDVDRVLGMLDYKDILGKDNDIPVQNVMDKEFVTIPTSMPILDAADLMTQINTNRLLVMDNGQLAGVVTRGDLIPELGKSFDPITSLPRADAMRDWGIAALKRGQEVTVIFIDLDRFGQYNKVHGHIVGDRILQHVAGILRQYADEDRDFVCRYAGDEFVIVTERNADEAEELARVVEAAISTTPNDDIPDSVSASIGLHGGKRSKEREEVHFNSTLDNLINLASKACTLAKFRKFEAQVDGQSSEHQMMENGGVAAIVSETEDACIEESDEFALLEAAPARSSQPLGFLTSGQFNQKRLKLKSLNFSWEGTSMATAEVVLANGESISKQARSGFAMGNNALRLVADATAQAVCEFLPECGYGVVVDNVQQIHAGDGIDIIVTTVLFITPQNQIRVSGSCLVKQDAYRSVSAAFLNAINRQISPLLA